MREQKISSFVRRTVYHLQVHLLFFPVLSRCPCSLAACLFVCLHICLSLCSSCSLLSVMSPQPQQKTQHPPDHDSIADILLHIAFLAFKCALNKSRCRWFLPDFISAPALEDRNQAVKQAELAVCHFPRAPGKWWEQGGHWVRFL